MKDVDIENSQSKVCTVFTVSDPVKAELIKNLLEDHGIRAELAGEHQGGFTGTFTIEIIVREKDALVAKDLITDHNL